MMGDSRNGKALEGVGVFKYLWLLLTLYRQDYFFSRHSRYNFR